jgi:selenocysteine lyase/cysteine desulfurase
MAWAEQRAVLRDRLAELIGAPAGSIALTSGTTRGITDLALCIPWRAGDRVLLFEGEFPANVTPWQQAAASLGAVPCFMALPASGGQTDVAGFLERLERELRAGVRLVAVSAVQFQTGLRMPLAEMARLCHAHGAELCVDAIQACGVVPIDVVREDIDYLVCGAHKWLLGVEGAAFVYVRPELRSALVPRVAGWLSHQDGELFLFHGRGLLRYDRPLKGSVAFLEGGSANVMGSAALGAAVDMIQSLGVPAIFEHVSRYLDELEIALTARGFVSLRSQVADCRSGILSVDVPDGVAAVELFARLRSEGIAVSLPDGRLRFAPHFSNSPSEIPVVLAAIDRIISG